MTDRVTRILTELRAHLRTDYSTRLTRGVVFGSHARGDAKADSDLDVLVVLEGEVDPGKEIRAQASYLSELSLRYGVTVSCAFVSSRRFAEESSPFMLNVRREGLPL